MLGDAHNPSVATPATAAASSDLCMMFSLGRRADDALLGCDVMSLSSNADRFNRPACLLWVVRFTSRRCQRHVRFTPISCRDVATPRMTRCAMNGRKLPRFESLIAVSYTHLRAHETRHDLVCRLLLEKKK